MYCVQVLATSGCSRLVMSWRVKRRSSKTHTSNSAYCSSRAGWTGVWVLCAFLREAVGDLRERLWWLSVKAAGLPHCLSTAGPKAGSRSNRPFFAQRGSWSCKSGSIVLHTLSSKAQVGRCVCVGVQPSLTLSCRSLFLSVSFPLPLYVAYAYITCRWAMYLGFAFFLLCVGYISLRRTPAFIKQPVYALLHMKQGGQPFTHSGKSDNNSDRGRGDHSSRLNTV